MHELIGALIQGLFELFVWCFDPKAWKIFVGLLIVIGVLTGFYFYTA